MYYEILYAFRVTDNTLYTGYCPDEETEVDLDMKQRWCNCHMTDDSCHHGDTYTCNQDIEGS